MRRVYRFFPLHMVTLALLMLTAVGGAQAHEVRPAVVTFQVTEDRSYELELKGNVEALLLEIGTAHGNTDDTPQAQEYNRLRGLDPQALEGEIRAGVAALQSNFRLSLDGAVAKPVLSAVHIDDNTDPGSARLTRVVFTGQVPNGAKEAQFWWAEKLGASVFRVQYASGEQGSSEWLKDGGSSRAVNLYLPESVATSDVFGDYLVLGFTHIVPLGLDHILFVLGLFLLSTRWKPLLLQVSAFTLAHTITLGMTIYGLVSLSPSIVEPLIALSIVFVAMENILSDRLHSHRVVLVFLFGLLHGMGFAGVLEELGLPESEFLTALISFNIGVELGQLAVIVGAYLLVAHWTRNKSWYRKGVVIPGSAVIGLIGTYWTVERVFF